MGQMLSKVQTVNNEGATVEVQNIIQGDHNTVNIEYTVTKEPELEDFNFPEPIDSFKGRADELKQLDEWLFQDKKSLVIVHGLPGFGKSELCKQLARNSKLGGKVQYICWIEASKIERLEHSLKQLAEILQLPRVDGRALMQKVSRRHADSGTLFVFDDVEGPRSLLDWRTPPGCWALATSQCSEWGELPGVAVGPLERLPAVELLQHLGGPAEQDPRALHTLAALLDHAPLALHLAAAYIRQETRLNPRTFNIRKYIQRLRKSREHFVDQPVLPHTFLPYQFCIQAAMNLSLEKIRGLNNFHSGLALDILNILAYLNKHQIKQDSLLQFSFIQNKLKTDEEEDEADDSEQEEEVRRALFVLESYSFVRLDDGFIRIHGLVQQTLLFYHNKTHINIDAYYISCLEYVLNDSTETHFLNVLKEADKKLEIYKKFYDVNKSNLLSGDEIRLLNKKLYANVMKSTFTDENSENLYKQICVFQEKSVQQHYSNEDIPEENNLFDDIQKFFKTNFNSNYRLTFLEMLVITGSQQCLSYTFGDLDSQAKEVISKHRLLTEAMYSYQPTIIKLLVQYGEDINSNKIAGGICTILHRAATCLNMEFIEMILGQGADVNARDVLGDTCICYAILSSLMMRLDTVTTMCQVIDQLVSRGARVYDVTATSCSLLHVVARWLRTPLHLPLLEHLLQNLHIDVNILNNDPEDGGSALHIILYRRINQTLEDDLTIKMVDLLLKHKTNVYLKNKNNITPLDLIKEHKFNFLVPILKDKGIHIDIDR